MPSTKQSLVKWQLNQSSFEFLQQPFSKTAHWAIWIDFLVWATVLWESIVNGTRLVLKVSILEYRFAQHDNNRSFLCCFCRLWFPISALAALAQSVYLWKCLCLSIMWILPEKKKKKVPLLHNLQNKSQWQDSGMHENTLLYLILTTEEQPSMEIVSYGRCGFKHSELQLLTFLSHPLLGSEE